MKRVTSILLALIMTFAFTACSKSEPAETVPEEEPAAELDVLAGTTYLQTAMEVNYDEGETESMEVDSEHATKIVFNTDGSYELTYYEPDYENNDPDTMIEKKESGTYIVDGNKATLSTFVVKPTDPNEDLTEEAVPISEEDAEALTPTVTIADNTLVEEREYRVITSEDGRENMYPGLKIVYTKQ